MAKTRTVYKNNGRTSLTANINSSVTTIPVTNASVFPSIVSSGDQFYVTLDDGVNIEIVLVTGVSGNNLIGCVRGQDQTTAHSYTTGTATVSHRVISQNLREFSRLDDRVGDLSDITQLKDPTTMNGNSYLCQGTNTEGHPLLAVSTGTIWRFPNYSAVVGSAAVGSGATTTSVQYTNASTWFPDTLAHAYIIQFTSGTHKGECRLVASVNTTTITWSGALSTTPGSGDTYEIYRWMGKNISDQVYFNTSDIASQGATIAGHTTTLATHTSQIAANTAQISTNTSDIALRATLASPTFTGDPKAPTPASTDSDTSIATTAFVQGLIANGAGNPVFGNPGQIKIAGLTIKWTSVFFGDSAFPVTWASTGLGAFAHSCVGILATPNTGYCAIPSYTASGFSIVADSGTSATAVVLAWGY